MGSCLEIRRESQQICDESAGLSGLEELLEVPNRPCNERQAIVTEGRGALLEGGVTQDVERPASREGAERAGPERARDWAEWLGSEQPGRAADDQRDADEVKGAIGTVLVRVSIKRK